MRGPRTLAGRMFLGVAAVVVTLLAVLGIVLDRVLEADLVSSLTDRLEAEARTVAVALPAGDSGLQAQVSRLAGAGGVRVTVIRTDGVVLADSERDPSTLENHADRPEVRRALAGRVGIAVRRSESTGEEYRYLALPVESGRIVRVAAPLTAIRAAQERVRSVVAAGILLCAAAVVVAALLVSRSLARPLGRLATSVDALGTGDLSARAEPGGAEEVAALARTVNDMATRLEQEVGTAREEQRTRDLILSAMEEGTLLAGPDGEIRFFNQSLERLLGGRPARVASLLPLALRESVERAGDGKEPVRTEFETGPGGHWLRCSAIPAGDGQVLLVVQDVTASRRLDSVRRDFVTNASHELKTPAASIQAAAETIRRAVADDPAVVPRFAAQLERDAVRLSRIVSDLLDLSRLESGTESTEPVSLDAVVEEVTGPFVDEAAARGIKLTVDADAASVRGSPRDLRLLLANLVDNALRYTAEGGTVDITLTTEDGDVVLRVADTGIGIPTRDLPRVFERFYRVDRARSRETGGTGLGLSIVKHVAENHGGTTTVTSELGRGSTFEVRLPLERAPARSPGGRP